MTQKSYPLTDQPFTDDQWSNVIGRLGDGIFDDWTNPYAIVVNTNDTVTVGVATSGLNRAVVGGFMHTQDAPETLSIPAVTNATRFQVGLLYDPTNTSLPVSLTVLTGLQPSMSGGKVFVPLVIFDRSPGQTLPAATRRQVRQRRTPSIAVDYADALNNLSPLLYLKGTIAVCFETGALYVADGTLAAPVWSSLEPTNPLFSMVAGGTVLAAVGKTTSLTTQTVVVSVETPVLISFTAGAQAGTPDLNWAGNVYIQVDGVSQGLYTRVHSLSAKGNAVLPLTRIAKATLAPGSRKIAALLAVDSLSGGSPYINYPQIEVWPA